VAALAEPAQLAGVRAHDLPALAFQLALHFGTQRYAGTGVVLGNVYERLAREVTPEDRAELVDDLAGAIGTRTTTVLALLPVLQHETDPAIVRSAAMAFATYLEPTPGEPLAGPRAIRALVDHADSDAIRAGLVGALLAIGDRRVRPLVDGLWRSLSPEAAALLLALPRPLASRLEVEWLLDWLEDADPATFAAIAASLARIPADGEGRVLELERELPAGTGGAAATVVSEWSVAETAAQLRERFESLARRAENPQAMAPALAAWGLRP